MITGFLLTLPSSIWLSVFMMSVILVIKMEMEISWWTLIALFYFGFPSACQIECMTFFVCLFCYFIVTVVGFLFSFVFVNLLLKKFGFALWGFYYHVTFFFSPLSLRSTTSQSHKLARLTIWLKAEVLNPNTSGNYLDWAIGMKFCVNSFGFSRCVDWDTFSFVTESTQYRFTFRISFAC